MIVKVDEFHAFLRRCAREKIGDFQDIILPARAPDGDNGKLFFKRLNDETDFNLEGYRTVDPIKMLFYLFREHMVNTKYEDKKRILAGVKACDLKGLEILDKAMITDEWYDPSYKHWRDQTYILSSDCTDIAETCHCNLVNNAPYAKSGFDINMSEFNGHYLLTTGTSKGKELIELFEKNGLDLKEVPGDAQGVIDKNRKAIVTRLEKNNAAYVRSQELNNLKSLPLDAWHEESEKCVGCGSCTNICPTCYCLILNDESEKDVFKKVRSYDSCQYNGYARVAGGASPRPMMDQRFRNRYLCKFVNMDSNFGEVGCSGCGRCTETCPGEIDFRKVVKDLDTLRVPEKAAAETGREV